MDSDQQSLCTIDTRWTINQQVVHTPHVAAVAVVSSLLTIYSSTIVADVYSFEQLVCQSSRRHTHHQNHNCHHHHKYDMCLSLANKFNKSHLLPSVSEVSEETISSSVSSSALGGNMRQAFTKLDPLSVVIVSVWFVRKYSRITASICLAITSYVCRPDEINKRNVSW